MEEALNVNLLICISFRKPRLSLFLSLWVKSLNRCVSSAKGIQLTVELLLTQGILTTWLEVLRNRHWFFMGGFLLDDYSWDSHIFRNNLCVMHLHWFSWLWIETFPFLGRTFIYLFFSDLFFFRSSSNHEFCWESYMEPLQYGEKSNLFHINDLIWLYFKHSLKLS